MSFLLLPRQHDKNYLVVFEGSLLQGHVGLTNTISDTTKGEILTPSVNPDWPSWGLCEG